MHQLPVTKYTYLHYQDRENQGAAWGSEAPLELAGPGLFRVRHWHFSSSLNFAAHRIELGNITNNFGMHGCLTAVIGTKP